MAAYRKIWSVIAGVVACVGLALALAAVPIGAVAGLVIFGLLVGSAMMWALQENAAAPPMRRVCWGAAVSAGVMVVIGGLSAVLGGVGLLVVLVMAVSSPVIIAWLRRGLSRRSWAGWPGEGPAVMPPRRDHGVERKPVGAAAARALFAIDASVLDDATLCGAWQMSNVVLHQRSATDLAQTMEVRRQLLDELERRHPATFSSWLASAPAATDDLTAYFTGHDNPPPAAGSSHVS